MHRINLSGGDDYDWPGEAVNYRGRMSDWTLYVDRFMRGHGVTDVLLFGDCRPVHIAARQMAQLRHIQVHVFEEGYIRPNWMTLELSGVNGNSRFERDPQRLLARATDLPPVPNLPPIIANSKRRARDSYWHYHYVCVGRLLRRYPHYWSHRPGSILSEGIAWLRKLALRKRVAREAERTLAAVVPGSYFLFPLQLSTDYQIRAHSPFSTMHQAVDYVMASFAEHAPADSLLLIKEHPLDISFRDWGTLISAHAKRLRIADRVLHVAGGDLNDLAVGSRGVVVVNSTSATFALAEGRPVITLGSAIYSMPGITHQGPLDTFWSAPTPPRRELYDAFLRCLHDYCLVRGGLASQSATRILVASAAERLLRPFNC
ncbi:capsular biosynthesis protein [Sphingomonas qilianensis]|uniref:Capsular biosynthesis protein n=1 Tax=Sphingomonas qilianensis TaxID=1736690 RepID=A0ABU9XRE7_9SPHN